MLKGYSPWSNTSRKPSSSGLPAVFQCHVIDFFSSHTIPDGLKNNAIFAGKIWKKSRVWGTIRGEQSGMDRKFSGNWKPDCAKTRWVSQIYCCDMALCLVIWINVIMAKHLIERTTGNSMSYGRWIVYHCNEVANIWSPLTIEYLLICACVQVFTRTNSFDNVRHYVYFVKKTSWNYSTAGRPSMWIFLF